MVRVIFRLLPLFAILFITALPGIAQQIQGQVRLSSTGMPAIGVLVRCDGTGGISEQVTDRTGKFNFHVSPGHYTLTVRASGYQNEQRSVDMLDSQQSEYILLNLRPQPGSTSTATAPPPDLIDPSVPSEARQEFDRAQAASGNDKITHLEKALSTYPKFLAAQLLLGATYMDLQQWDKAETPLKKAQEIDPKAANAYFALGEVYLHQKKYDQAEKSLQDGLAIETRSPRAHLTLARVYWDKVAGVKDEAQWRPSLEKAYQEVKQALDLDPNLAPAHLLKGNLYFKVRRAEDALKEFDEYLRLDPNGEFAAPTRDLAEKIRKALAQQKKP